MAKITPLTPSKAEHQSAMLDRTPWSSPTSYSFLPSLAFKTSSVDSVIEATAELVVPFSAANCFDVFGDFSVALGIILQDNSRMCQEAQLLTQPLNSLPQCLNGTCTELGAQFEYAFFFRNSVYWLTEEVRTFTNSSSPKYKPQFDADGNEIYLFASKLIDSKTKPENSLPFRKLSNHFVFSTFRKDKEQCHIKWVKRFIKTTPGSTFSYLHSFIDLKNYFQCSMQRELQCLREFYFQSFSARLPKKDDKVCVIGAGPSGLHMTYLLIQKGVDPKNITLLEKDNRYGGKTLSILDKTNKQLFEPEFNPPRNKIFDTISTVFSELEVVKDLFALFARGDLSSTEKKQQETVNRKWLPNVLLPKDKEEEYFENGEDIYHELGTCYLSPGYYAVRQLLHEIQSKVEKKTEQVSNSQQCSLEEKESWAKRQKADITREVGPDTYAIQSKSFFKNVSEAETKAKTLDEWVYFSGKDLTYLDEALFCCPKTGVNASVLHAKRVYCSLHEKLMGEYYFTLPPKPNESNMNELLLPFGEFLKKHNLSTLAPLFTYALTAQGYGIVSETPTFLAMQWLTPDLLDGYFEWHSYFSLFKDSNGTPVKEIPETLKKFDNFRKGMLVSGWGSLWERIVALYNLESRLIFNCDVKEIKRSKTEVKVTYSAFGQETKVETFDFLIVAAPLTDPADINKHNSAKPLINLDFTSEERRLFLENDIEAGKFRTTLFKPQKNGPFEKDHLRIFIDEIQGESSGVGTVFGIRDSYKAIQPRLSTKNGDKFDPTKNVPKRVREKMCYQYVSPSKVQELTEENLKEKFKKFITRNDDYLLDNKISDEIVEKSIKLHEKAWTYYLHYNEKGLLNGKLWDILEIQGSNRTFFVHATTSFESVLDIVNYNNMLFDGLCGKFDTYLEPETDSRPKQYEKPVEYLFNNLHGRYYVRLILNFFITIIWTLYYCLTVFIAEKTYLRFQRYDLQKAFLTPKLGNPWEYDMKKFINVSPTTRGLSNFINNKDNGIPKTNIPEEFDPYENEGDHIFKCLNAPKFSFRKKFPHIPTSSSIETSIQYNLTDFRIGIRFWLTTFEDSFQPLLTDNVQNILEAFGNFFPNFYSWFLCWIFASQFRLLIGYSFRVEDDKGGYLYIPHCHMLKTAVEEHGIELGQRVCLTVCKIFTEEVMKKKKLSISFEPEFVKNHGFGCKVRTYNSKDHAFSNHSTFDFRTIAEKQAFEKLDLSW